MHSHMQRLRVRTASLVLTRQRFLTTTTPTRESFLLVARAAADDPVNDYRELAKLNIWEGLLNSTGKGKCRILDTCAGTGRWAQAFSELVVKDSEVACDFIDSCDNSLAVLAQRQQNLPNLGCGELFSGDLCALGELGVPSLAYDIIVNMHGLYGIPKSSLPLALQAMHDALKPGGTMVIAIGHDSSPYQRVPKDTLGVSYTSEDEILTALSALGIRSSVSYITYEEQFRAQDQEAMNVFIRDECGANTFPTNASGAIVSKQNNIKEYADAHFDAITGTHRFPQKTAVITVVRDGALLPEMQSYGPYYSEAYTLRREASTMQSNTIGWLRDNAAKSILQAAGRASEQRPLKICSIGCGDGELDIAMMEGIVGSLEQWGYSGIDFLGLEPSPSFRQKFMDSFGSVLGGKPISLRLEAETFDGRTESEHIRPGEADLVLLGHVMYYFQDKGAALEAAMKLARPGGRTVVIIQGKEGVPELQTLLLPQLRGGVRDVCTADDVETLLTSAVKCDVVERHDVPAFLDVSEIAKGSEAGVKIMSFCLEADHRDAADDIRRQTQDAFTSGAVPEAEAWRTGGPFLKESVACFVVSAVA